MKLGTCKVHNSQLQSYHYGSCLQSVCEYLNKERPDINPEWVVQITPVRLVDKFYEDHWIVVYRFP